MRYAEAKREEHITPIVKHYHHLSQQTPLGCGVCSVLMAVSAVCPDFQPDDTMERHWLRQLRRMRRAIPIFELMRMMDHFGLKMAIGFEGALQHQDSNDPLVRHTITSLRHFQKKGSIIRHQENARIDTYTVIEAIQQGGVVLLNGMAHDTPHMRVCVGFMDAGLIIADPLEKQSTIVPPEQFDDLFSPPYGKWMMAVSKP